MTAPNVGAVIDQRFGARGDADPGPSLTTDDCIW